MNTFKFLWSLVIVALVFPLAAQDDDFFLRGEKDEEDEILESTEFLQDDDDQYLDDVIFRTLVEDNRVLDYAPLDEIDVMWEKRIWRVVDTREKMNMSFRNEDRPLFEILKDLSDNGDIKVFEDEKFREVVGADELSRKLNRIDTVVVYDPETYEEQIKITESPVNPDDIKRYRIKEVWYFDKKHSAMKVRILGIAPIKDEFDNETGEYKYSFPLFWVYYPKARRFLAKERVPNDFNDLSPMSWYQLFEDRFFASYIIKASNSLGLRLQDMHPDSEYDQLLESELIKQDLFNWEHDLWTY